MKLAFTCRQCYGETLLDSNYTNREVAREACKSDDLFTTCKHCGLQGRTHLNEIYAVANPYTMIQSILFGLGKAVLFAYALNFYDASFYAYGLVLVLVLYGPVIVWRRENERAHHFNLQRLESDVR